MALIGLERERSDRALLGRHRWVASSALLMLCACDGVFDSGDLLEALGEHGHGAWGSGSACGSERREPFGPIRSEPADASLEVEPDASLRFAFSRELDPASAALAALELTGPGGAPVAGSVAVDGCGVSFTPSQRLVLNTAYVLRLDGSVRARHGSEWTGTVEAELRTRDGAWRSPVNVTSIGNAPRLSAAPDGSAVVAWQVPAGAISAAVALARFTPGELWQELPISGTSGGPYSIPRLVQVDEGGNIELLWYNTGELYAGVYRVGEGLGETSTRDYQASTPDGDGAIVGGHTWAAANERAGIVLKHTSGRAPWFEQTLFPMSDGSSQPRPSGPRLTVDGSGQLKVFWLTEQALQFATLDPGQAPTSWTAPQSLVPREPGYVVPVAFGLGSPFVDAESELGHALLAWQEDERAAADPESGAASRLRVVQVAPDGSVDESRPESLAPLGNAFSPALAMNASGDALLAWAESDGLAADPQAPSSARVAFRAAGTPWSTSLALQPSVAARARAPAVAVDASGNGHAVWLELGPSGNVQLRAARFTRDTGELSGWSVISGAAAPAAVPPEFGGNAPQLVVDPTGRALAVWAEAGGGIWSARFE